MALHDVLLASSLQPPLHLALPALDLADGLEKLLHHPELLAGCGDLRLEEGVRAHERLQLAGGAMLEWECGEEECAFESWLWQNGEAICGICEEFINCLHGKQKNNKRVME